MVSTLQESQKTQKDEVGEVVRRWSQYTVTVPANLVRAKGWGKGTRLEWEINRDGDLVLREVKAQRGT